MKETEAMGHKVIRLLNAKVDAIFANHFVICLKWFKVFENLLGHFRLGE